MQDENQDHIPEKPHIYMVDRSPLLQKAEYFTRMLQDDQNRIQQLKSQGKQKEISMEEIDDNDDEIIQMKVVRGFLEAKNLAQDVIPLDTTEMPADSWRKATEETKKE